VLRLPGNNISYYQPWLFVHVLVVVESLALRRARAASRPMLLQPACVVTVSVSPHTIRKKQQLYSTVQYVRTSLC
jgi:hypothetical protein